MDKKIKNVQKYIVNKIHDVYTNTLREYAKSTHLII